MLLRLNPFYSKRQHQQLGRQHGFTLIELMVAVAVMALLAVLSWRGLDGMSRVQTQTQAKTDGVLALQAGLAQWQTDLDAIMQFAQMAGGGLGNGSVSTGLHYDGQVLRLVRRYSDSDGNTTTAGQSTTAPTSTTETTEAGTTLPPNERIRVVAWSQRKIDGKTQWLRWQSPAAATRAELQAAWLQAAQWAQNPSEDDKKRELVIAAIDQWQIFYYRNDAWSNALSSADAATGAAGSDQLPDGVRLVLTLSAGEALVGNITRDWIRPTVGGGK